MFTVNKITMHNDVSNLTHLRTLGAQREPPFSLITAPEGGGLNEKRCKTLKEFGILELEVGKTTITRKPQEINIMLDESGSMNDSGEGGDCDSDSDSDDEDKHSTSKMDLTKHVVKNIMEFVLNECKESDVKIGVHAFNTHVREIFERTTITSENIENLTKLVQDIHAMDGTNMEESLITLKSLEPISNNAEKNNILMSDGDANEGISDAKKLAKKVDSKATNYFVGFGLEHNPQIFAALSARENSSYYFVDKIDKSGLTYGEILYNIMYNKYKSVKLEIVNPDGQTLMYDYLNNEWRTQIFIGKMSGEMKKTIHIASNTKEKNIVIKVTGYDAETDEQIEQIIIWDQEVDDLSKYIFRQNALELISIAKTCHNMNPTDLKNMKYELKMFTLEMKEYMKNHGLLEDKLMMSLCDDIIVIYRTIGTEHGLMYSCSRQSSQGAQRLNANSNIPMNSNKIRRNTGIQRACMSSYDPDCQRGCAPSSSSSSVFNFEPKDEFDELINNHTMTEVELTTTQSHVMNLISKTE